jgi:hypothetical protein
LRRIDNRCGLVFFPQRWHFDGIGSQAAIGMTSAASG